MLQLTRKTDYALVALSHLALRQREGAGPSSARCIAESHQLPLPLLMNILKELAQAKLVRSTRGAAGGYELIAEPGRVTLLEVIVALEGPIKLTPCCDGLPIVGQGCCAAESCPIQSAIQQLHRRMKDFFSSVTLKELFDTPNATSTENPNPCACAIAELTHSKLPTSGATRKA